MTDQKMQDAKRNDRSGKMIKLLTLPDSQRDHIHGSDEGSIKHSAGWAICALPFNN